MEDNKNKSEEISAFAFDTGRAIEKFINNHNNNLQLNNQLLQAKILDFHSKHKNFTGTIEELLKVYKATFNIIEVVNGKIDLEDLNTEDFKTN